MNFYYACSECINRPFLESSLIKSDFICTNCNEISKVKINLLCEHFACEKCLDTNGLEFSSKPIKKQDHINYIDESEEIKQE